MIKIFLTALFISFTFLVQGQVANAVPSITVKKQIDILKNADLGLNDIQLSRITTVLISEDLNLQKVQQVLEGNKTLLTQRLKEMQESKISNVKGAMTPLQAEKFDALKIASKL